MTWNCIGCNKEIIADSNVDDMAVCKECQKSNVENLVIQENIDQFKKELLSLLYADTWEHWYLSVREWDWFTKRWGITERGKLVET